MNGKVVTKIIYSCTECDDCQTREASQYIYYTCRLTRDNHTAEIAQNGFPESCPLLNSLGWSETHDESLIMANEIMFNYYKTCALKSLGIPIHSGYIDEWIVCSARAFTIERLN